MQPPEVPTAQAVERVFREQYGRILATLIRVLGDFDIAEDALQEAFIAAVEYWQTTGTPDNATAWLTTTARNKAVSRLRREHTQSKLRDQVKRGLLAIFNSATTDAPAATGSVHDKAVRALSDLSSRQSDAKGECAVLTVNDVGKPCA